MIVQRLRPWLTRLYPRDWRERYADEFDALLEQSLHTPLDVLDVFLGAMDARLQLLNCENVNWRKLNTMNKLRTTILVVFASFIGFVIAGFALVGIADDSPMVPLMHTNSALSVSWKLIQAGAVIALLAILVGGLPLWITLIRQAFKVNRRMLPLLAVPVIALLVLLAYTAFVFLVSTGRILISGVVQVVPGGSFPPGNRLLLSGLILVFILGAVASTWAIWKAVTSIEAYSATHPVGQSLNLNLFRFAFLPAVIATLSMLVIFVSTLVWGWISFTAFPQVFSGNFGPLLTSTRAWYFGIVGLMLLGSIAAVTSVLRARKVNIPA